MFGFSSERLLFYAWESSSPDGGVLNCGVAILVIDTVDLLIGLVVDRILRIHTVGK